MPCSRAYARARRWFRLATATTSARLLSLTPFRIARLIRAVESKPQRTASLTGSHASERDRRTGRSRAVERIDRARLSNGVLASQERIHSAADSVAEVLDFEPIRDRKSTRLNSSHRCISYAVF